jgi:competence ComEA-like helix-hairpin-helix protein
MPGSFRIPRTLAPLCLAFGVAASAGCTHSINIPPPPQAVERSQNAINLNTASEDELGRLPYIGAKTAAEIVEFRMENGGFHRPEQLLLLRGISEKRYREIRKYVVAE